LAFEKEVFPIKTIIIVSIALAFVTGATQQAVQEGPKACGQLKEHQWLGQLVGEWSYEAECVVDPNQPPVKCRGTETARSLGDVWVVAEGAGSAPTGAPMSMMITPAQEEIRRHLHLFRDDRPLDL